MGTKGRFCGEEEFTFHPTHDAHDIDGTCRKANKGPTFELITPNSMRVYGQYDESSLSVCDSLGV